MEQQGRAPAQAGDTRSGAETLRERRGRELREQLSGIATRMFLERGFDAVRVEDVAREAGVTKKTVFNHFPSKEALLADRWEAMRERVVVEIADPHASVLEAAQRVLWDELEQLLSPAGGAILGSHREDLIRFRELTDSTPALRAHESRELDRLASVIALAIEGQAFVGGASLKAAESVVVAAATVGLWRVFYQSLSRALLPTTGVLDLSEVKQNVRQDLDCARALLERGL